MRIVYEYSHLGGSEILKVRYPSIDREITGVIKDIAGLTKLKASKEKTMQGEMLYSPKDLNERLANGFHRLGFHEIRDTYTICLPNYKPKIVGAFKQVDFVKSKVLVEAQFGKYAFMFYDMAKFQYFFNENKADVGVENRAVSCHAQADVYGRVVR